MAGARAAAAAEAANRGTAGAGRSHAPGPVCAGGLLLLLSGRARGAPRPLLAAGHTARLGH